MGLTNLFKSIKVPKAFIYPVAGGVGIGAGAYLAGSGISSGLEQIGKNTLQKFSGLIILMILVVLALLVIKTWKRS